MLNSPIPDPLIKQPFPAQPIPPVQTLMLNQIEGWEPVEDFTDSDGVHWKLAKASTDSTVDVPDPKSIMVLNCWCAPFPRDLSQKLYLYAVEGLRPPRVATEQPSRILYQWFSTMQIDFNPSMITQREWMKANVYAAPVRDSRPSKLMAMCKVRQEERQAPKTAAQEEQGLLKIAELADGGSGNLQRNKKAGREG